MGLSPANAARVPRRRWRRARPGRAASLDTLAIHASTTVHLTDDVAGTIARMKPRVALYVGGMGARDHNFHKDAMVRRGYADAAERIQELFLAGRRDEAIAAVPDEYVDEGALLGSPDRIAKRFVPVDRVRHHRADDPHRPGRGDRAHGRARRPSTKGARVTDDAAYEFIAVDDPAPGVRRITLNRPEKRNAINNGMRAELFAALEAADVDDARARHDRPRRGPVLLVGLRPEARRRRRAARTTRPAATAAGRATSPRAGCASGISPSR